MSSGSYDLILPFLGSRNRPDVRHAAISSLLELTASVEGRQNLYKNCPGVINSVISLLKDSDPVVVKNSFIFLINISSDKEGTVLMLKDRSQNSPSKEEAAAKDNILSLLLDNVLDPKSSLADHASAVLANITRYPAQTDQLYDFLERKKEKYRIQNLASAFTRNNYNEVKCFLDHLAFFFANLSQSTKFRSIFLNHEDNIIKNFLPFISYEKSLIKRSGVVALIKNCCFNEGSHEWLLSSDVDILPHLLLPLAGPEQFDDEDNEKLPVDLQYLPEDKTRESEPFIRKSLLETLLLLCATAKCRTMIRDLNAYVILRELHKWEKDNEVLLACENVVDILIRLHLQSLNHLSQKSDFKYMKTNMAKVMRAELNNATSIQQHKRNIPTACYTQLTANRLLVCIMAAAGKSVGRKGKRIMQREHMKHILFRKEEEIGVDNLLELEVPSDLKEKFNKLNLENQKN